MFLLKETALGRARGYSNEIPVLNKWRVLFQGPIVKYLSYRDMRKLNHKNKMKYIAELKLKIKGKEP